MSQCVVIATDGTLVASTADPCTGLVVMTPTEYASWSNSILNLSAEDGFLLSTAVLAVWLAAWSWKALIRALDVDGYSSDS